jgi:hypothetical protein
MKNTYKIFSGRPEGRRQLGDPDVEGRLILKWIIKMWDVRVWTELILFRVWAACWFL